MEYNLKDPFISFLKSRHPSLQQEDLNPFVSENLLSPFVVDLPKSLLEQAKDFVQAAFTLRENKSYQSHYASQLSELQIIDPGNKAIAMSYDFHVDEKGELKLIEVNTNAAFLAMSLEMYEFKKIPNPIQDFSQQNLKECFLKELELNGSKNNRPKVAIIDEDPQTQRLFIEFLVYNSYFKQWDWQTQILDFSKADESFDLIYNRYNDFFLNEPRSSHLKKMWLDKKVCFSPNPFEYFLLADKQRMIDWCEPGFVEKFLDLGLQTMLKRNLPPATTLTSQNANELWATRKHLFFKPKRAFGSKQSFRGGSISRKAFDEIVNDDFIAQTFVPAHEKSFETPAGSQNFKYDLRFYVYQDQIQSVVARLYQGQVTNLRTAHGGFACVRFN